MCSVISVQNEYVINWGSGLGIMAQLGFVLWLGLAVRYCGAARPMYKLVTL